MGPLKPCVGPLQPCVWYHSSLAWDHSSLVWYHPSLVWDHSSLVCGTTQALYRARLCQVLVKPRSRLSQALHGTTQGGSHWYHRESLQGVTGTKAVTAGSHWYHRESLQGVTGTKGVTGTTGSHIGLVWSHAGVVATKVVRKRSCNHRGSTSRECP